AKAFEAAQHILAEAEPHDAMGVPCDVSMRQLRRRFGCLTKLLSGYDDPEILAAFQKVKVAFDEMRSMRSVETTEDKKQAPI
ncbi:unnamed protein product, partial [Durusdinium trenchii]